MEQNTMFYDISKLQEELIKTTLNEIIEALEERGYDPINQIVGYLISGDPGYISNYKEARTKMISLDRSEVVKHILKNYIG